MIDSLQNFTRKSWNNYSGPENKFNTKNILFGYNGKGKSSLAQGLYQEALASGLTKNNIRLFNKDYIKRELLLAYETQNEEPSRIRGIIASFGEKAINIDNKINELQQEIVDTTQLEKQMHALEKEIHQIVDQTHDDKKGNTRIQKKSGEDILKIIDLYNNDLAKALKIEANYENLIEIKGDDSFSKNISFIRSLDFKQYNINFDDDLAKLKAIFKKTSYPEIEIPNPSIVEWMNTGLGLHYHTNKCHFCGNIINYEKIKKLVLEYNANEKQKDIKTLQAIDVKISEAQNISITNISNLEKIIAIVEDTTQLNNQSAKLSEVLSSITSIKNIIQRKIHDINNCNIHLSNVDSIFTKLKKYNDKIIELKEAIIAGLETKNSNLEALVKGAIALSLKNNHILQQKITNLKQNKQRISKIIKDNVEKQEQIQQLLSSKSATSVFATYISDVLVDLGINLRLAVSDDSKNYIITRAKNGDDPLDIEDISEGEKNMLAILFFYYELFKESTQNSLKESIQLIIIDDPITSLDETNAIYITSLIEHLLSVKDVQMFVLTHSWNFFTNVSYHFKESTENNVTEFSYFEVKKNAESESFVEKTKANITPYHHNFQEVYNFSQRISIDTTNDCEIYHMPNIIRQVLEGFLSFKSKKSNPTKNNETEIAKALFNKELSEIGQNNKAKLTTLLLLININSHKSSRNPNEVLESAKFLMNRIKQVDPQHFNANKTA